MNIGNFAVLDARDADDVAAWVELWQQWPDREVSAHPAYGRLFVADTDVLFCAVYTTPDGGAALYPFVSREITQTLEGAEEGEVLRDIITPYGYGGPFAWGLSDADEASADFWSQLDQWLRDHNVVSEFVRFSLRQEALLPYPGVQTSRMKNIVRSLDLDEDALWMDLAHSVRKDVKKARRSGITIAVDESGEDLDEFMRIYAGTMKRREAGSWYYFPKSFFEAINSELRGQFAYFHAYLDGRIVSTELVLVSETSVYSFLGGTDSSAFEFRPNGLLKYEVIRWAQERGIQRFVLGGGAAPGDGIERFKRSLAPNGAIDFVTGERVLQPSLYARLVAARRAQFADEGKDWPETSNYFPAYRMPL